VNLIGGFVGVLLLRFIPATTFALHSGNHFRQDYFLAFDGRDDKRHCSRLFHCRPESWVVACLRRISEFLRGQIPSSHRSFGSAMAGSYLLGSAPRSRPMHFASPGFGIKAKHTTPSANSMEKVEIKSPTT